MLITERKFGIWKFVNIYFMEEPETESLPDCDVVTFYTYKNWGDIEGYEKNKYLTTIIDLNQDIDVIWRKIKRQHRRHIRRAEKNCTNVTISNNYEEFHQVLKNFLKRKNYADPSGLNVISSKFMQKYGILFIAENQGEILGGNLYFHDEHNALLICHAYQNGNTIENYKRIADANCYLHWEAMKYFKNMDIINYDISDVSCDELNINHQMNGGDYFKLSFGGDVISRYTYMKFNYRFYKLLFQSWNFLRSLHDSRPRLIKNSNNFP